MLAKQQKNLNIILTNSLRIIGIPKKLSQVDFFIEIDGHFKTHKKRFKHDSTILHHHTVSSIYLTKNLLLLHKYHVCKLKLFT